MTVTKKSPEQLAKQAEYMRAYRSPADAVKIAWAANLAKLTGQERLDLQTQEETFREYSWYCADVVSGIGWGFGTGKAGETTVFPDSVWRTISDWLPTHKLVTVAADEVFLHFNQGELGGTFREALGRSDDENHVRFGLRTRLSEREYYEMSYNAMIWGDLNPDERDPYIQEAIKKYVAELRLSKPALLADWDMRYWKSRMPVVKHISAAEALLKVKRESDEKWIRDIRTIQEA